MTVRVGINGFGRIGRNVFRGSYKDPEVEFVAINDLVDAEMVAYLLKYDSVHGILDADVKADGDNLVVDGKQYRIFSERNPADIPWGDLGVDYVVEATGVFRDKKQAMAHIEGGAKKVIISAPAKNEDITIVMGVNEDRYDPQQHDVVSNASCTTNCLAPVAKVLDDEFGIKRGLMTTVHSYTNDQNILDLPHKKKRRARAAGINIIPTTTGAAVAVGLVLPQLDGKLDGFALRVPTPDVSVVDLTCELEKKAGVDAVNAAFKAAAEGDLKGILGYEEEELVSMDYKGDPRSSIVDGPMTCEIDGDMIKVVAWYDNEWAYSLRVIDLIKYMASK